MKLLSLVLAAALAFTVLDADAARRFGGGKSVGKQSNNVIQRDGSPATPAAPAQNATNAAPAAAGATGAAAAAAKPSRPWGAMLGGLAAGLGLAWLASSLGLGAAFGQFLMIALLVGAVLVVVGLVMRSRKNKSGTTSSGMAGGSPFAFQGAGTSPNAAATPHQYSPDKVGNDASARPWERTSMAFDAGGIGQTTGAGQGSMIGSALTGSQSWSIPEGFDTAGFLQSAKQNFTMLQNAWDQSDIASLRLMMTDGMLTEIRAQLAEREAHTGGQSNKTDVVMLEASLLGIEDLGDDYMVSVEFSGMIREEPSSGPSPFREVWNMTKPKSGSSGWLVAGVQALQ